MFGFIQKINWDAVLGTTIRVGKDILIAVLLLLLGTLVLKGIRKGMIKTGVDTLVSKFILSALKVLLYIVIIILLLGAVGVNTASIVTVLSAVGLSLSLALKDSLSSVAQGVFLLAVRPFSAGQKIEVEDIQGVVRKITLFYTEIVVEKEDNTETDNDERVVRTTESDGEKIAFIPNNRVSKAILITKDKNPSAETPR
ncbi:MAG: mechanosensitive ion channel [Oscillospiraceae bacterium]|nr:mechanosensitive ion channel [Oscillospiraceae bacterium]